jgi:hypothetical protein
MISQLDTHSRESCEHFKRFQFETDIDEQFTTSTKLVRKRLSHSAGIDAFHQ